MTLTLIGARKECERAGVLLAELNGAGPGFAFPCPICAGQVTVTAHDQGEAQHECSNGCDRAQIGYELFSRQLRSPVEDPPLGPGASWMPVDLAAILAGGSRD